MTAVAMLIGPVTSEKGWESESTYPIPNAVDSIFIVNRLYDIPVASITRIPYAPGTHECRKSDSKR